MHQLKLDQDECDVLFGFKGRSSRRYKSGDGKVPLSALKLLRLMARGALTKQQVIRA
jgi:hypothetical protein